MERKLVKQGRNALTVTLPAKWLQSKGLVAGDSVFITENNRELIIGAQLSAASLSTTIDVAGCDRSMIFHTAIAKYIQGYDTIIIHHDCQRVINELARKFIGMVVEEQTATRAVWKSIIAVPEDNFEAILRRAAHIFVQQARTLELVAKGEAEFDQLKSDELLLDQHILYCMRYLNKYETQQHAYRYFLVCATMELAGDQISRIGKFIGKNHALAKIIVTGIEEYVRLLFSHDYKRLYTSLRSFRNQVGTKSFAEGLVFTLAEILYNYLGYIAESEK
jgi:phosphate uptake regulator